MIILYIALKFDGQLREFSSNFIRNFGLHNKFESFKVILEIVFSQQRITKSYNTKNNYKILK